MKTYNIKIGDRQFEIIQDDDGKFIRPDILKELDKFGTAMKPAHEPICLARKPLAEKTVAENVLKYGTGGINIDESRVGTEERINKGMSSLGVMHDDNWKPQEVENTVSGRFPANLLHDNSEEVRECFPETKSGDIRPHKQQHTNNIKVMNSKDITISRDGDSGNASRFFKSILYYPKASKSERNKGCEGLEDKKYNTNITPKEGSIAKYGYEKAKKIMEEKCSNQNNHPTVKPTALMSYLIKMITPKNGIVLEPFAGSGSTLVAARDNGFQYIGIEMTEEYLPIIQARTGCDIIKPENPLDCLTDKFKETGKWKMEGIADKIIELKEEKSKLCPSCGSKYTYKMKKGCMCCEECMCEF